MSRALLVLSLLALACDAPAADPDSGPAAADAGRDAGSTEEDAGSIADAGSMDDAGSDAGPAPDGGPTTPGSIEWSSELDNPYELTLTEEIALDYFLQYTVVLPAPNDPPAMIRLEICQQVAGAASPSCTNHDSVASEGTGGLRYGLDPTNYAEGLNLYTFTARLMTGSTIVDEAVLEWRVTYAPGT